MKNLKLIKTAVVLAIAFTFAGCKKAEQLSGTMDTNSKMATTAINSAAALVTPPDFTIALLPDIQFYTDPGPEGGLEDMLTKEIKWIMDNREAENIVYVGGLGDISDSGDQSWSDPQWDVAQNNVYGNKTGYAKGLETPQTGMPYGIPYGLCTGNHDQRISGGVEGPDKPCAKYNGVFGLAHFNNASHPYWAGTYSTANNNSHYQRFSVGTSPNKMDFLVIHINYDLNHDVPAITQWAYNLCSANASSKVIVITHYITDTSIPAVWSTQGLAIWNKLKGLSNVFMFAGGHLTGEGYRQDTYNGKTIKTFQTDYQSWAAGGNGYFRLMKFSAANDLITVRSYSPYLNDWLSSPQSNFIRPWFHSSTGVRLYDYVNQGKSQLSFFNSGVWKVNGQANQTVGIAGDIACPGDYDGDGKTDMVVFRPSNATWYNLPGGATAVWGNPNSADIPVPADYTGDGKSDLAIFRPAEGKWYIQGKGSYVLGQNGDIPLVGDNNGDGIADLTVYRPSNFTFYRNGGLPNVTFPGASAADIPVPGDYNADGITNTVAIYRPSTGEWIIDGMTTSKWPATPIAGVIPCPGDFDGDGDFEKAYYNPADGKIYNSTTGVATSMPAASGDKIVNLPYPVRQLFFP